MSNLELRADTPTPRPTLGQVFLVGAGPGDPELITVRGLKLVQRAEVLVYDRLVGHELIDEAPDWAEKIYVGKRPGFHAMAQEKINALLIERARLGQTVVRLKGGDPFIFGRGGEEALACAEAGVAYEVVPGISSSAAVPANAGIPLTHRGVAASFTVVTAHRAPELDDDNSTWQSLARVDTLVILMGVARLAQIAQSLVCHGRSQRTPVAIIERGTLASERITIGTLEDIASKAQRADVRSPATIVVGEVVRLRDQLTASMHRAELDVFYTHLKPRS